MQRAKLAFAIPLALLSFAGGPLLGDDHDKKTDVTITEPVQIPGERCWLRAATCSF